MFLILPKLLQAIFLDTFLNPWWLPPAVESSDTLPATCEN